MFKIHDGRDIFYQWDTDRKIIVSDPSITEIHFSNGTNNRALVVGVYEQDGARLANVPNVLLQERWDIMAYAYCGDCYTKQSARFKVNARPKPEDYIYEETEIKSLEYLENRIEEVESIAKGAVGGKSFTNLEQLVNTLKNASDTEFARAQHMLIATLGVPDVWIYEISSQHSDYAYSSDEDFCAELKDTGFVQVGYYVLAPLETQKVDLTDYVKKDYVDDGFLPKYDKSGANRLYGVNRQGAQTIFLCADTNGTFVVNRIPTYVNDNNSATIEPDGALNTKIPVKDYQCANKKYVDDLIAAIDARLKAGGL
jgi:hypothetical protein